MEIAPDPYNLQRFVNAQESTFDAARAELIAGQKRSHWMWFIFPQIKGLGSSPTAQRFAIFSLDEGAAYLEHPFLDVDSRSARSSLTALPVPSKMFLAIPTI